jgi:PilZ domain-containing protein
MDFGSLTLQKRREQRIRMVLPLRVSAKDTSDAQFEELAHTLDITAHGARLGAIRHPLKMGTTIVVQYRQHKLQCRVVWVRPLEGTKEYQVGVELLENRRDLWGLDLNAVKIVQEPEAELVMA